MLGSEFLYLGADRAYRALGIGAGDEVIVPAYTFFASAATVVAANAIPAIADVDDSLSLDPEPREQAITPRIKAIAAVHMCGAPAQMDAFLDLTNAKVYPWSRTLRRPGGFIRGQRLGSLGTIGCFSFDYDKIIGSGEGGFVTTDDEWLYTRAQAGTTRPPVGVPTVSPANGGKANSSPAKTTA